MRAIDTMTLCCCQILIFMHIGCQKGRGGEVFWRGHDFMENAMQKIEVNFATLEET